MTDSARGGAKGAAEMGDPSSGGWTSERVELLGKLWAEGYSASQIATALGGGVTRNAVIGKVHRLGLAGRGKSGQPAPARPARPRPAAASGSGEAARRAPPAVESGDVSVAAQSTSEVVISVSDRVSILELREGMCRWPIGDPARAEFGFCGGRAAIGLPYCPHHCTVAYQPAAERRRLRA